MKDIIVKTVLPLMIAAFLCVYLLRAFYQNVDAEMTASYNVVAIGDSIIGKERDGDGVHAFFTEASGLTMYNGAFGGSCASASGDDDKYSYNEESLNLCRMAEAICQKDFGVQRADMSASRVKSWYFDEAMQELAKIDFEQVDFLLIEFGVNDYSSGRKLDNPEDLYDVYTCGGALRYALQMLQKTYPNLHLVMITPIYCWLPEHDVCTKEDFGYGTLDQFVELEREIAAAYDVDLIDMFAESGFDESNILDYTEDGEHLNEEGRRIYGAYLGERIKEMARTQKEEGKCL